MTSRAVAVTLFGLFTAATAAHLAAVTGTWHPSRVSMRRSSPVIGA